MKNPAWGGDRRIQVFFFALAVILYFPGIWWGLPYATAPDRILPWGSDEIAPLGSIAELYSVFTRSSKINPQYPLFHYVVQAVFVVPYLLWLWLTGKLANPSVNYPYGLSDPVSALATMTLLARVASLIMAAGVVVVAYKTASILWNKRTGIIAGFLVLLMYPMFYYSRTSNVDIGALFWTSLGLAIFAVCLRDSMSPMRAVWIGLFAGLAIATKDASYAVFLMIAAVLIPRHMRQQLQSRAGWWKACKAPSLGLLVGAGIYSVASGLLFHPDRYFTHVRFVTSTTAAYTYANTLDGYLGLLQETFTHIIDALGSPTVFFALVGIILCAWRARSDLSLVIPALGILVGTILPIHFVNFRYVLVVAYVLVVFAAYGLSAAFVARSRLLSKIAPIMLVIVCGWSLLRGADLTYQMIYDSRYQLAAWLQQNAKPGDRIGYYGAAQKLPHLHPQINLVPAEGLCTPAVWRSPEAPKFVLVIPQQHFEAVHEWTLTEKIYQSLLTGSLGYQQILRTQTRSLFSKRPVSFVNPPVQVFAKDHWMPLRGNNSRITEAKPVLSELEGWLGLETERPRGLVRNLKLKRNVQLCPAGAHW